MTSQQLQVKLLPFQQLPIKLFPFQQQPLRVMKNPWLWWHQQETITLPETSLWFQYKKAVSLQVLNWYCLAKNYIVFLSCNFNITKLRNCRAWLGAQLGLWPLLWRRVCDNFSDVGFVTTSPTLGLWPLLRRRVCDHFLDVGFATTFLTLGLMSPTSGIRLVPNQD